MVSPVVRSIRLLLSSVSSHWPYHCFETDPIQNVLIIPRINHIQPNSRFNFIHKLHYLNTIIPIFKFISHFVHYNSSSFSLHTRKAELLLKCFFLFQLFTFFNSRIICAQFPRNIPHLILKWIVYPLDSTILLLLHPPSTHFFVSIPITSGVF